MGKEGEKEMKIEPLSHGEIEGQKDKEKLHGEKLPLSYASSSQHFVIV